MESIKGQNDDPKVITGEVDQSAEDYKLMLNQLSEKAEAKAKVDENKDSVAFSIFPSHITDVIKVADNKLTMPPKSTWFDPKPLDGLVVYEFGK